MARAVSGIGVVLVTVAVVLAAGLAIGRHRRAPISPPHPAGAATVTIKEWSLAISSDPIEASGTRLTIANEGKMPHRLAFSFASGRFRGTTFARTGLLKPGEVVTMDLSPGREVVRIYDDTADNVQKHHMATLVQAV